VTGSGTPADPAVGADPGWRVGLDTGGTFIDVVAYHERSGRLHVAKVPSDASAAEMLAPLAEFGVDPLDVLVHGTTRVTNAVLENNLARTALVTTQGFSDVLAIGRQARTDLYDPTARARPEPVVPAELCFEADERSNADGSTLVSLDDAEVQRIRDALEAASAEAVAVCLLHGYANPSHERRIAQALSDMWPVSVSHEVSPERREYERASTTALNASVLGLADRYLDQVEQATGRLAPDAMVHVVLSTGGMVTSHTVRRIPLATVMSGPASGVAAGRRLLADTGAHLALSFDMGGTSTDVALLVGGEVTSVRDHRLGGHVIRLPGADIDSVAIGGGSIAWLDDVGALRVGPQSAGASPGPACFGRGGTSPTVTDADLVLGLIESGSRLGNIEVDESAARASIAPLASRLGLSVEMAAEAILEVTYAQLERALARVSVNRGYDLADCVLVAFGGSGAVHGGAIARRTGIRRVVVPALAPVFSALGCCLAELALEAARTYRAQLCDTALAQASSILDGMAGDQAARLQEHSAVSRLRVERVLELHYVGQNDQLPIAWEPGVPVPELRQEFDLAHQREFGYRTEERVEIVALRCRVSVPRQLGWPVSGARPAEGAGVGDIAGPAVIPMALGAVAVSEGQVARRDALGNIVLEPA
jgi:N-methylhydantoinase A